MSKAIVEVLDCVSELVVRLNDKEQYTDILERLKALSDAVQLSKSTGYKAPKEKKAPSERKRDPGKYYYLGIDVLDKSVAERPRVCEFVICKGYNEVLRFHLDNELRWVCVERNGVWGRVSRFSMQKNKTGARTMLKKLAQAEEKEPGAFAREHIPCDLCVAPPAPLASSTDALVVLEPKAEEPKAEEPKAEEPKAEEPKAEEPKALFVSGLTATVVPAKTRKSSKSSK